MSMRRRFLLRAAALYLSEVLTVAAEEVPEAVGRIAAALQDWGANPILVEAVRQQNAQARSLDEIRQTDAAWAAATDLTPLMKALQSNRAAQELKRLEKTRPYFFEVFLMDRQGANVAMTNKTSDYWQGDEDKFKASFNHGQGALHVGDVRFDSSSQVYLVQISVPVMNSGAAIGAITIGIDLDLLQEMNP